MPALMAAAMPRPGPSMSVTRPARTRVLENPPRSVAAAVVDDDDLERPAVALRVDRVERVAQPAAAVVDRHHEADADGWGRHAERRSSGDAAIDDVAIERFEPLADHVGAEELPHCVPRHARALPPTAFGQRGSTRSRRASESTSPTGTMCPPPTVPMISPAPLSLQTMTGVPAEQRFERDQAEDFVLRRIDDDVRGGERVEAVATFEQADVQRRASASRRLSSARIPCRCRR